MSDSEEEDNYCFFGKPLEPYDEDAIPKKRPITVEEQIATDAHGRRRFHGAFTGGFSAGFYNSVGSLEGWTPSEFKSSRQEKTQLRQQKPQDFMDDEDAGEFGFAPEVVRATKDYSTTSKRKRPVFSEGPIPGEPVLESLIRSGDETIGYLLLKNIGFKDKLDLKKQIEWGQKTYGCEMPSTHEVETISLVVEEDSCRIPEIYKKFLANPKNDSFGMGYSGLDKSTLNLFKSTNFVVVEQNKKKLSISGQAFGVGAFEEDDEDIYAKEDMSRYDFEITKESNPSTSKKVEHKIFDMFILSKELPHNNIRFPPPTIPHSFTGKHKVRKSRFEPLSKEIESEKVVSRKEINPSIRAKYLGEAINDSYTPSKDVTLSSKDQNNQKNDDLKKQEIIEIKTNTTSLSLEPNILFDKFVTASQSDDHTNILEPVKQSESLHGTKDMREAVRMKLFGPLTRVSQEWLPCPLLCKRFNVPEPNYDGSTSSKNKKRTKPLIFQYQQNNEIENSFKPGLKIVKDEKIEETAPDLDIDSSKDAVVSQTMDVCPEDASSAVELSAASAEISAEKIMTTEQGQENSSFDNIEIVEKPKELTDRLNIEKNIDLFKAVFLSSSESESEEESQEEIQEKGITEEMKFNILSDDFLPKIKPIKQGILSNIDMLQFRKPTSTNSDVTVAVAEEIQKKTDNVCENLYGPKIPDVLPKKLNLSNTGVIESSSDENEWIEKDKQSKKKKKHKKKHKKEHKHKKNKKSRD